MFGENTMTICKIDDFGSGQWFTQLLLMVRYNRACIIVNPVSERACFKSHDPANSKSERFVQSTQAEAVFFFLSSLPIWADFETHLPTNQKLGMESLVA